MKTLDLSTLPSVDQAKEMARTLRQAEEERAREKHDHSQDRGRDDGGTLTLQEEARLRQIDEKRAAMDNAQIARRLSLHQLEQAILLSQQQERLALHAAQKSEASGLFFRFRTKVADLVSGLPALRSVIGHITERTGLDPRERHRLENEALARRHEREKIVIEGRKKALDKIDRRERMALKRDLKREAIAARVEQENRRKRAGATTRKPTRSRTDPRLLAEGALGTTFNARAQNTSDTHNEEGSTEEGRKLRENWQRAQQRDTRKNHTDPRLLKEDGLSEEFDAALQAHQADSSDQGDGEDGRRPRKSWKQRAAEKGQRRSRGRGYGMKRDGDG